MSGKEEQAQEKYLEFQLLQKQLEQLQGHLEEVQTKIVEFHQTRDALHELQGVKQDADCFVSVAQGIFARARLQQPDELLINVGAETAVVKTIPQVVELLNRQIAEVAQLHEQLESNMGKLSERINMLVEEIQQL